MNFEFELDENVIDEIGLFNKILADLNAPMLFENPDFRLDRDSAGTNGISFTIESAKKNTAQMWLFLECDGVRLDIDGMNELFEWKSVFIKNSVEEFTDFIKHLLTGYILIDTRGASRFVQIFDESGFFVHSISYNDSLHFFTGLYLFRKKSYQRLFLPIYSESE